MKWFIHDFGYRHRLSSGKTETYKFKNVHITDSQDPDNLEGVWIVVQVHKDTEKRDMQLVELLRAATEMWEKLYPGKPLDLNPNRVTAEITNKQLTLL